LQGDDRHRRACLVCGGGGGGGSGSGSASYRRVLSTSSSIAATREMDALLVEQKADGRRLDGSDACLVPSRHGHSCHRYAGWG